VVLAVTFLTCFREVHVSGFPMGVFSSAKEVSGYRHKLCHQYVHAYSSKFIDQIIRSFAEMLLLKNARSWVLEDDDLKIKGMV
jgi:hypothetical protein